MNFGFDRSGTKICRTRIKEPLIVLKLYGLYAQSIQGLVRVLGQNISCSVNGGNIMQQNRF